MKKAFSLTAHSAENLLFNEKTFNISFLDSQGTLLNGIVKQLSDKDFQVFVQEKQVIVNYLKCNNNEIICTLNSKRLIPWIDGFRDEISKKVF